MRFFSRKVIIVLLLGASAPVYAQRLYIAPEAAYTFSNFRPEDKNVNVTNNAVKFSAGAAIGMKLNKHWYINSGLSIVRKGFTAETYSSPGFNNVYNLNFTTIQMPLSIGFEFSPGYGTFFFEMGPYISYYLGSQGSRTTVRSVLQNEMPSIGNPAYGPGNPLEFGLSAAAGYRLPCGLFFKVQYNKAFNSINMSDLGPFRQNSLFISAGYVFTLNKHKKGKR